MPRSKEDMARALRSYDRQRAAAKAPGADPRAVRADDENWGSPVYLGQPMPTERPDPQTERAFAELAPKPTVVVNHRELIDVVHDTLSAIAEHDALDPRLFLRGGQIVTVTQDESGRAMILTANRHRMRYAASEAARFITDGTNVRSVHPALDMIDALLATPTDLLPFGPLVGITEAPIIRPDGSIRSCRGYDPATGLYYSPAKALHLPQVARQPTAAHVQAAVAVLADLIGDFPFVDAASRANALGLIVTAAVRSAIDGPVPLAVISATSPGTGKSKLTDIVAIIATGRPASNISWASDEDEARKLITSALLSGNVLLPLDNIEGQLRSKNLASVLTSKEWSDRVLGSSHKVNLPVRVTFIANGNGLVLSGDLPRRAYWIKMAAGFRPWLRDGFKYPNLEEHVLRNRGQILHAVLTLARHWYALGCPAPQLRPLGSFEGWNRMVGGILESAGIEGFMGNAHEAFEDADTETVEWSTFLYAIERWMQQEKLRVFTCNQLVKHIIEHGITFGWPDFLPLEIAAITARPNAAQLLGFQLRKREHTPLDEQEIHVKTAGKDRNKVQQFTIARARP